jgi:DNA-binding HxlR family transcriptional regulator
MLIVPRKARIVWALIRTETVRYSQVRAARSPISDRILSKELRELEELGLISRKEYPVVPPKTEYQLTTVDGRSRKRSCPSWIRVGTVSPSAFAVWMWRKKASLERFRVLIRLN